MPPSLIALLKTASGDQNNFDLIDFRDAEIRWAITTGLGPLLFRSIAGGPISFDPSLTMTLKAADLTARIETGEKVDAMCEIIDACAGAIPPLVLLKGISTCTQYYPEPHLRSMADIDVLIEEQFIGAVESVLINLGYSRPSEVSSEFYQTHHHTAPFYDPRRDVWVEIHRRLLPRRTKSAQSEVFSPENVAKELRLSQIQGLAVRRLSDELQIIHTSAHWAQQLQTNHGLMAMLDIVYIIKHAGYRLDWSTITRWVKLRPPTIEFCLLLAYLAHHEVVVIDRDIIRRLTSADNAFTEEKLRLLFWLTDRYIAQGRPFDLIFSLRNVSIIWHTLISTQSLTEAFILLPLRLVLPSHLRAHI
jgi:Uncharacterised nucleotidyltransferase